jgi:hypothetical protein
VSPKAAALKACSYHRALILCDITIAGTANIEDSDGVRIRGSATEIARHDAPGNIQRAKYQVPGAFMGAALNLRIEPNLGA